MGYMMHFQTTYNQVLVMFLRLLNRKYIIYIASHPQPPNMWDS